MRFMVHGSEFFQTIWQELIIAILLSSGGIIFAWLRSRSKKGEVIQQEIDDLRKFRYRATKTIIILAKLVDAHIEESDHDRKSELEEVVKELLDTTDTTKEA